jgi:hypothetical protein
VGPGGDVVDEAVPSWVMGAGCGSLVQAAASTSIAARRRQAVISSAYRGPGLFCSAARPTGRVEPAMTMLETAEIRWFFKDSAPSAVRDWFAEDRNLSVEERTDTYLVFPGCESVGVKLRDAGPGRETKFEVKAIRGAPQVINLPSGVAGRADSWVKWSHSTSAFDQLPALGGNESTWVATRKRRLLRRFSMDQDSLQEKPIDEPPSAGCNIDLVDLDTADGAWWTLGFESFGPATDLRSLLHAVATSWFDRHPPPVPLRVTSSIAYPTWVAGLPRENQERAPGH